MAGSSSTIRELTIEKVRQVALSQDQFGVTAFLATCTTDSHDVLSHALATIARAIASCPKWRRAFRAFISKGRSFRPTTARAARIRSSMCARRTGTNSSQLAGRRRGQDQAARRSRPSTRTRPTFIRRVADSGVLVAIGHTKATSDQIQGRRRCRGADEHAPGQRRASDDPPASELHLGSTGRRSADGQPDCRWASSAAGRRQVDGAGQNAGANRPGQRHHVDGRHAAGPISDGPGRAEVLPSGKLVPAGQPGILAGASLPIHVCVANVMRFADLARRSRQHGQPRGPRL